MFGRKIVLFKLYLLTILGKNQKKSELLRKSNMFAQYGRGGTGIQRGYPLIQN